MQTYKSLPEGLMWALGAWSWKMKPISMVKRTSHLALMFIALAGSWLAAVTPNAYSAEGLKFSSTRAAFEQGIQAYRAGYYEIAEPALIYAAERKSFVAQFYLARIYADSTGAFYDRGRAYRLYYRIVRDNFDIDRFVDKRAVFVSKSLTELAVFLREGVDEIGVRADPVKAAEYIHMSATNFMDRDAQFELAKLYFTGQGVPKNNSLGRHYLSVLTPKGHAGAQALLADLHWRGKHGVAKDKTKALALITLAVENAPEAERIWIEQIHQQIYCGSTTGIRKQSTGLVADWIKIFGTIVQKRRRPGVRGTGVRGVSFAQRVCGNGEVMPARRAFGRHESLDPLPRNDQGDTQEALPRDQLRAPISATVGGFGMRDVRARIK